MKYEKNYVKVHHLHYDERQRRWRPVKEDEKITTTLIPEVKIWPFPKIDVPFVQKVKQCLHNVHITSLDEHGNNVVRLLVSLDGCYLFSTFIDAFFSIKRSISDKTKAFYQSADVKLAFVQWEMANRDISIGVTVSFPNNSSTFQFSIYDLPNFWKFEEEIGIFSS